MIYIKTFENFKVKNITEDDVIECIKNGGYIYSTIIRNFPENDPEEPLKALSIDEDGLITIEFDGNEYEVDLKNVEKIDIPEGIKEELKSSTYRSAAEKFKKLGHLDKHDNLNKWALSKDFDKYGNFDLMSITPRIPSQGGGYGMVERTGKIKSINYDIEFYDDDNGTLSFIFIFEDGLMSKITLSLQIFKDSEFYEGGNVKIEQYARFALFTNRKSAIKFKKVLNDLGGFIIQNEDFDDDTLFNVLKEELYKSWDVSPMHTDYIFNKFKNINAKSLMAGSGIKSGNVDEVFYELNKLNETS